MDRVTNPLTVKDVPPILFRALQDERFFVRNCLSIVDKNGQSVRFIPNKPQCLLEQRSHGKNFFYVLKARKEGISSRIIASDLWACATQKNQHAVLVTHSQDAATKMLEERIKPMLRSSILPLGAEERGEYIKFPATNSWYYVGTSGAKAWGRGDDITRYHLSEVAHWEDPAILTAIEQAATNNAVGRIETTANGYNFARKIWEDAKLGANRYTPIFIPWYCSDDYKIAGAMLSDLSEEERNLIEAFKLTHEQLAWRRSKLKDMSEPALFVQEYPSNDIEAFLSSGRPVFDWVSMLRHENACLEPKWLGDLRDDGKRVNLVPSKQGELKIWLMPEPGHVYVVGGDVAEGLKDGAYSAAVVIDAGSDEQVAEWHGHIAPDLFGDIMVDIGHYYNNAMLCPESWPGPGAVTMSRIRERGYSYVWIDHQDRAESPREGWETNSKTKPKMIHDLAAAVRDLRIGIKSKSLISEMRSYVYDSRGHMEPSPGSFSDIIMATAIAWQVAKMEGEGISYTSPRVSDFGHRRISVSKPSSSGYGVRRE